MVELFNFSGYISDIGAIFSHVAQFAQMLSPPNIDPLPRTTNADSAFIQRALNVVFVVIGAVAVLMVVIGGIKFAGSQGDPQGVAKAKNTIIYAIVGLIVAILATVIVDIIFGRITA